jgi:uncharacterized protein (DUF1800 family)
MTVRSRIAAIRFGYGLRLGEAPPADAEAWLESQLRNPGPPPPVLRATQAIQARAIHVVLRDEALAKGEVQLSERSQALRQRLVSFGVEIPARSPFTDLIRSELTLWAARRLTSPEGFRERLVAFWSNHFTTSRRGGAMGALPASMEHEAIRPNLTGKFADMLVAVTKHPAMLVYLSNVASVGPNSPSGQGGRGGLNENLAREVLELHTLSPAGGYTQGDVQELAKILTGWRVAPERPPFDFVWQATAHEPGPKTLLGRRFEEGEGSQEAALRFLAAQPATARHIAVKLARHFVADNPPPGAIRALEQAFRRSDGDLLQVYLALIRLPEAWDPPLSKLRAPQDYTIAAGRALGLEAERAEMLATGAAGLGQPLWLAPQPNGWPDTTAAWAAPEALMRRLDWAYTLAGRIAPRDIAAMTEAALGPLARAETVSALRGAGSLRDATALLLGSPEFMRR